MDTLSYKLSSKYKPTNIGYLCGSASLGLWLYDENVGIAAHNHTQLIVIFADIRILIVAFIVIRVGLTPSEWQSQQ